MRADRRGGKIAKAFEVALRHAVANSRKELFWPPHLITAYERMSRSN